MQYRAGVCVAIVSLIFSMAFSPLPVHADEEFTLIAAVVGEGGNIWLPSTLIVQKGEKVRLTLRNLATKEHGFSIDGLGVKEVVEAGASQEISLTAKKSGVFRFYCQLHKGHVGGQLLVQ